MRLELGHPVRCSDGPAGELADVVIDPIRRRVTHLVVAPHHRHRLARLVPAEVAATEGTSAEIALSCSSEELHRFPPVDEFAFLRLGEFPLQDPDWDVGIQNVLAQPYYDYSGFDVGPVPLDPRVGIIYDRVPKGEVEIRRGSEVVSSDGRRVGHVDGFLVDRDDAITHIVLERGHLFGRREVTIPIGSVARVVTDSVALGLTKDEVRRLPAVPVHRWTALLDPDTSEKQQDAPAPS
jgi:sporulation protein YlmC with PRC-barrel domain